MPILHSDFKSDEQAIIQIGSAVCNFWNNNGGLQHGIKLFVSAAGAHDISRDGDRALASFFPTEPGPFKRVASLLILSRLAPLFALATPDSQPGNGAIKPVAQALHEEWIARICFLMIAPAFRMLNITLPGATSVPVDKWHDFPSLHSKTEFIFWLEWLKDYPSNYFPADVGDDERIDRKGRMILATALILEAVYYQANDLPDICSACDRQLIGQVDNRLLFFDAILRFNNLHHQT